MKVALLSALNEEKAHLETRMALEDRGASETHQMLLSNVTLVAFEELCLSPFEYGPLILISTHFSVITSLANLL